MNTQNHILPSNRFSAADWLLLTPQGQIANFPPKTVKQVVPPTIPRGNLSPADGEKKTEIPNHANGNRFDAPTGLDPRVLAVIHDLKRATPETQARDRTRAAQNQIRRPNSVDAVRKDEIRAGGQGLEVQIDISVMPNSPEAAIAKAETARRVALGRDHPLPGDLAAAALVRQIVNTARFSGGRGGTYADRNSYLPPVESQIDKKG